MADYDPGPAVPKEYGIACPCGSTDIHQRRAGSLIFSCDSCCLWFLIDWERKIPVDVRGRRAVSDSCF